MVDYIYAIKNIIINPVKDNGHLAGVVLGHEKICFLLCAHLES